MSDGQVIQGVIGGILAIGGICLAMSGGNLWRRKLKWHIGLGLPLTGIGLFMLITSFPQYAIGFSVLATLALALGAFLSVIENRRIREEDRALNFKLKLLDEVRDWAREAVKLGFLYGRAKNAAEKHQVIDMIEDIAKISDVTDIVTEIFKNELEAPVTKALGFVKGYKDPSKFASKEYFDSLYELLKAINSVKRELYSKTEIT